VLADPRAPHPDERLLLAPTGAVVVFNSHTWHGGTLNQSAHPRRAMHSYFCRRNQNNSSISAAARALKRRCACSVWSVTAWMAPETTGAVSETQARP
jgi:ectoine hydroxylase-related dioxygenase (phytanoyl-CoA dioxygenase family)